MTGQPFSSSNVNGFNPSNGFNNGPSNGLNSGHSNGASNGNNSPLNELAFLQTSMSTGMSPTSRPVSFFFFFGIAMRCLQFILIHSRIFFFNFPAFSGRYKAEQSQPPEIRILGP